MKKAKVPRAEQILLLAGQTVHRTVAMRIALVAAIAEGGTPVDRILSRMDRTLASIEKSQPALAAACAPHVAELKHLIANPPE